MIINIQLAEHRSHFANNRIKLHLNCAVNGLRLWAEIK